MLIDNMKIHIGFSAFEAIQENSSRAQWIREKRVDSFAFTARAVLSLGSCAVMIVKYFVTFLSLR